jgi:hypothetical protein
MASTKISKETLRGIRLLKNVRDYIDSLTDSPPTESERARAEPILQLGEIMLQDARLFLYDNSIDPMRRVRQIITGPVNQTRKQARKCETNAVNS